ncbi:carbohydrate ABC transporter permease [Thermocaproicibacter melissae]|uniref:carbohydrate ABC transporter permease n=1 Tax=Thermocaproicibacter melissae TaxID=2966552 RepID=UPI0024B05430|nr:carbohydrate ABC transporter permease [Thermocaproicibacter melissae]WBY63866.1 carbohydrate ABC transporter permease [Thermocaproicibacter melissae]
MVKRRTKGDIIFNIINYTVFILFTFICVYPFYYIFINTISANDLSENGQVLFYPIKVHFDNYANIFSISGFGEATFVTVMRTILATVVTLIGSSLLGFLFTKEMWHRKFWYRFLIITMYFNAGLIPWFMTMRTLGLTNNFLAYILPAVVSPFNVIMVKTYIESTPVALQEAAEIDGAGIMTIFTKIVLPLCKPILATIAIFSAVGQWNSFQDTLILMTDSHLYTLQYLLYVYLNQANSLAAIVQNSMDAKTIQNAATQITPTAIKMTITMVVVFPILFVYPFFQRYFTKGIMIGAVKG